MWMEILIGILSFALIMAAIAIRNLLKQNEQLEDDLVGYITSMREFSQRTLETMEEIDSRGAFASDDEVGAVFNDLKNVVEQLNQRISEYDVRSQKKEE